MFRFKHLAAAAAVASLFTTAVQAQDMDGAEKVKFVGKVFVFLLTAGFAYPHILQD